MSLTSTGDCDGEEALQAEEIIANGRSLYAPYYDFLHLAVLKTEAV
jgi:hypothetical protein